MNQTHQLPILYQSIYINIHLYIHIKYNLYYSMQAQKTKKIFQLRKTATSKLSSLPPD
jgi:hypothetical protein